MSSNPLSITPVPAQPSSVSQREDTPSNSHSSAATRKFASVRSTPNSSTNISSTHGKGTKRSRSRQYVYAAFFAFDSFLYIFLH